MPRLDDLNPERLDALVDGASPNDPDERELVEMMSELRGLEPEAPDSLAEKVRSLGDGADAEPESGGVAPDLWARLSAPFRSRPKLAWGLAPAVAVIALAVIVVPSAIDGGNPDSSSVLADAAVESTDGAAGESFPGDDPDLLASPGSPEIEQDGDAAADLALDESQADAVARDRESPLEAAPSASAPLEKPGVPGTFRATDPAAGGVAPDALPPSTDPGRPQELFGQTTLGVSDAKALSDATAGAMELARDLGGFTERSEFGTSSGDRGRAEMVLRVPTGKTDTALAGFAKLGTVIDQQVSINDLGEELAAVEDNVTRLSKRVAELKTDLAKSPDDSRLKNQLASAERALEQAKRAKTTTTEQIEERTQFSTLNLSIVITDEIGSTDENRFGAAIDRSWDRLAGVLAGVLEVVITASPLILVAGLGIWGLRAARRRSSNGLLAKP